MPSTEEDHPLPRISEAMEDQGDSATGNNSVNPNIRRYLVLLHDCICIKFITVQQAQQRQKLQQKSHNFHQQCCHYPSADEYGDGGIHSASGSTSCQPPGVSVNTSDCYCRKGGKCDWKLNNEDSSDKGDHQECQMGYQHHHHPSNQSSSSAVKGCSGKIDNALGDQVTHQKAPLINTNNKTNKSTSSVQNNKGDYDVISNHNHCMKCSNNTEWESRNKPNDSLNDAKGTSRSVKDEYCQHSGNNNICRSSIISKVDHSMQALFLYKEFREINMSCFWNSAVHEAFRNLEYKGSIVPSTIIVGSPIRKHLTVLKTAWSRKMLRSPSGYLIDFLGEIEELIADPIGKSHFVPLSDSLCWAIHELTSSGQEAFVDDIFLSLASAFPGMALPTKELIYQTLEKLTRERKIYQTAQGYFVVTPDTNRYIMSTEPLLLQNRSDSAASAAAAANFIRDNILLKASTSPLPPPSISSSLRPMSPLPPPQNHNAESKDKSSHEVQTEPTAPSPDPDTYSLPYGTFRRYNSLRIRKSASGTSTGCLPRRTLSMRLPKSKSKGSKSGRQDVTGSFQNLDGAQVQQPVNKQLLSRRRKHKSFLSRLLSFRGVRKSGSRKDKGRNGAKGHSPIQKVDKNSSVLITSGLSNEDESGGEGSATNTTTTPSPGNLATISTQTSFSIENLNGDLHLLSLGNASGQSKSSTLDREDSDSGRCTDSHSDADAEITAALNRGLTPIHSMHDHFHLHPSRRVGSSGSCNVYEKIESDLGLKVEVDDVPCDGRSPRSPSSQMSISPSPSSFLGGRQNARHNLYSRCHSSASSSANSYRDFYNIYRRRYPSYQQSTPTPTSPTSLESGDNLEVRFKPHIPIRYPPRSFERKQIFDEITRSSFKEKKPRGNKVVSICTDNNVPKPCRAGEENNTRQSSSSSPSTTYLTQTLKNTTNLELEFRLPLGNIFNAAMGLKDKNSTERSSKEKNSESESTLNEVNTTVNDLFTIKSFVKTNPFNDELSSTIEFKTNSKAANYTEPISSKPFADIHTKFNRESEII